MSDNTIFVRKYNNDDTRFVINEREIWRYAGYFGLKDDIEEGLAKELAITIELLKDSFTYKVCYRRLDISWDNGMPVLPFECNSRNLATCLNKCNEIIIFAATIGINVDRMIARYQRFSPVKALLMQAYGAERIECLCDIFCKEIREDVEQLHRTVTPRYSPGYGDMPLEKQKDIFALLDCNRQIGISLNESLLMTPSKSVTAIFGISDKGDNVSNNKLAPDGKKCAGCNKKDCGFRKNDADL